MPKNALTRSLLSLYAIAPCLPSFQILPYMPLLITHDPARSGESLWTSLSR